eukprot:COSAG01_NODE_11625_length_1893_cov_1.266444_1_plen_158_part_00
MTVASLPTQHDMRERPRRGDGGAHQSPVSLFLVHHLLCLPHRLLLEHLLLLHFLRLDLKLHGVAFLHLAVVVRLSLLLLEQPVCRTSHVRVSERAPTRNTRTARCSHACSHAWLLTLLVLQILLGLGQQLRIKLLVSLALHSLARLLELQNLRTLRG